MTYFRFDSYIYKWLLGYDFLSPNTNMLPPIQQALNSARTEKKLTSATLSAAEGEYKDLKKTTDTLKTDDNKEFQRIKKETETISKRDFRPDNIEKFGHLYIVLQKHGKRDNVWSSFSLLLECHNHVNKGKTGWNKGQPARPQPDPPKKVGPQNRRSSSRGGTPHGYIHESERRKDLTKNEKQFMEFNSRHMSVTPQNVGQQNPRSSTHGGMPREYNDGSDHRKGPEYRNDLGQYEERIQELNRKLESSKSVTAEQSRIIEEKERMIQDLTTRLSRTASQQLTQGNPNIADLSDVNRPTKLGERFGQVYDDQWSEAYEALKEKGKRDDEIVVELAKIVQDIYLFMQNCVKELLHQLASKTSEVIKNPFQTPSGEIHVLKGLDVTVSDLVKTHGHHTLEAVKKKSLDKHSAQKTDPRIRDYVNILSELIWLMVVQDPPMVLKFIEKGEKMDTNIFKPYTKSGSIVAVCVWPALYLHKDGPLVGRGFALPQ